MALQRVRTLQAFLMCFLMLLSVQTVGLSALLDIENGAGTAPDSSTVGNSHEFGGSTASLAGLIDATVR